MDPTGRIPLAPAGPNISSQQESGFFRLPPELRGIIYGLVLVIGTVRFYELDGGFYVPEKPRLALLRTNRRIYRETIEVVYGSNVFSPVDPQGEYELLESFLNCIGPANTSFLSNLTIRFPVMGREDKVLKLKEGCSQLLKLFQQKCPRLTTLTMQIYDPGSGLNEDIQDDVIDKAFSQILEELQAIPSLKKTIVEDHSGLKRPVKLLMEKHGWKVLRTTS